MKRNPRIFRTTAGVILALAVSVFVLAEKPKLLLYNRTPSVPVGWYLYAGRTPARGALIAFELPRTPMYEPVANRPTFACSSR